jgi:hypothetical protein
MSDKELLDAIAAEPQETVDLTKVREKAVELRDAYLQKGDLENQLRENQSRIVKIERNELPDMFTSAKISSVTVEADGNHPAFVASRETVYTAKIPDERRQEAFQWFETTGNGDLIKSTINIIFGMQEHEKRLRVMKLLSDAGIEYYTNEQVHHMTLKAFVKHELQAGRIIPFDLLGAFIFDEVKIK